MATILRIALSLLLIASNLAPALGQTQSPSTDLAAKLAVIEKAIGEKRKEIGVPGAAVAIVRDDRVIFAKGFGQRDSERNLPATAETLFAIGSCSKAFTAMSVVISADEGKLSLDDSPKKYLPYFKLRDAEADAKITVRDLLHHSSGLDRTDVSWFTGVLTREEIIRVAGLAKPTAKFREKFQYQNTMYAAAGEVDAAANKSAWEDIIVTRFFKPLGMKTSTTSVRQMVEAADYATGYSLDNKQTKKTWLRDLQNVAPAGAINSNVKEMAEWLRLMLGKGVYEGKRFVSEKGFAEIVKPQIKMGPNSYGLGWGLAEWMGEKVVSHGGGIDGFNSDVTFLPERNLGVVTLTNVSSSSLPTYVRETVMKIMLGKTDPDAVAGAPTMAPEKEVGKYKLVSVLIEVLFKDGKLRANVPGQPEYELINVGGRKYKLGSPAPEGFFMTFRPQAGNPAENEMYLEQPQGNYVAPRVSGAEPAVAMAKLPQYQELLGKYDFSGTGVEIATKGDKVVFIVPGQPPYSLIAREKDLYGAAELPDSYAMKIKRDAEGKIAGFIMKQPNGEFEAKRVSGPSAPPADAAITVDELVTKVIAAAGGEANLRKHRSLRSTTSFVLEHQGLEGEVIAFAKAPNMAASVTTIQALGKKIGTQRSYFDGAAGGEESSFTYPEPLKDKQLEDARIGSDFYEPLNWRTLYSAVKIREKTKLGMDEVWVVVKTPAKGNEIVDYYSAETFMLLKRDRTTTISGGGTMPVSETYSEYRNVDGVMLPFKVFTVNPSIGTITATVKDVTFDVEIPDATFKPVAKK
jgi:CubicO group peptidase (beta-lactamase class C family)